MATSVIYELHVKDKASGPLRQVASSADEAADSIDDAGQSSDGSAKQIAKISTAAKAAAAALAALAVAGTVKLGKSSVQLASDIESAENQLAILTGSSDFARERVEKLFQLTKETPFLFEDLVKAETTLTSFGANAEEMLPALIDVSAALGQDVAEAAHAVGKAFGAGSAGADALRERMPKLFAMMQEELGGRKGDIDAFRTALQNALSDETFAGGAERLSNTFAGAFSNLQGQVTNFQLAVANAGLFETVRETVIAINESLGESGAEIGSLAAVVSDSLSGAFKATAVAVVAILRAAQGVRMAIQGWSMIFDLLEQKLAAFAVAFGKLQLRSIELLRGADSDAAERQREALQGLIKAEREATAERREGVKQARAMKREMEALKKLSEAIGGAGGTIGTAPAPAGIATTKQQEQQKQIKQSIGDAERATVSLQAFNDQLALMSDLPLAERVERMRDAIFDAFSNQAISLDEMNKATAKLQKLERQLSVQRDKEAIAEQKRIEEAAAAAAKAADDMRLAQIQSFEQVGQALSSVVSGGISGITSILGMLGPQGAAVGAFAGAFHALGEKGASAVADDLAGAVDVLVAGVLELPELLTEALPQVMEEMIASLAENAPQIAAALVQALLLAMPSMVAAMVRGVFDAMTAMVDAILSSVGLGQQGRETIGGFGRVAAGIATAGRSEIVRALTDCREYQTGGYVDRTGLAMVHAGERVTPAHGAATHTTRAAMGGGGGGVNLTVNTNVVDPNSIPALVREIERVFGQNGRGSSPLFAV